MGRDDVAVFEPQLLNDHGRRKTGNLLVNGASPVEEYQKHKKEASSILEPITGGKNSKPQQHKHQDTQQQGCQQREYDHYAGDSSSLAVRVPSYASNWSSTLAVASDEFDGSGGDHKQHRRHSVDKESSSPISPQVSVDDHKTCFFYAESCLGSVGSDDYQNELDGSFGAMDSRVVDFFTTPNPTSTFKTIEEDNMEGGTITTTTHIDQVVKEEAGRRPLGTSALTGPIEVASEVERNNFTQERTTTSVSTPTSCSPLHPTAFSSGSTFPVFPQQKRVAVPSKYQGNLNPLPALMPVDPTAKYRKISKTYGSSTSLNVDLVTLFKEHEQYVAALKLAAPKVRPSPFPFIHDLRMQQRRQKKEPITAPNNSRVRNISTPFGSSGHSSANDHRHQQQRVSAVQPVDFFTPSSSSSSSPHHPFRQYPGSHQQPPPQRGGGFF